jgi:protein-S-isoprenylcysteine O-methyltransferase Ste14
MTIFGIGPKLLGLALAYSIIPAALTMVYPGFFAITSVPPGILYSFGGILLTLGLALWLLSIFPLLKGFTQGKLCTTGVYSIVRNPMYSAFILFFVPAITMFIRSWIMFTIPMVMCLIFNKLIRAEELYLEGQFGEEYLKYKSAVNSLIPSVKSFKLNLGS